MIRRVRTHGLSRQMLRALRAAVVGVVLATAIMVPVTLPTSSAQAAGGSVYIDEPLQSGSLAGWSIQGAGNSSTATGAQGPAWQPRLSTVAENNAIAHSFNTNSCGTGVTPDQWPACTATRDAFRDSRWLTLTTDDTNNGAGQAGTALHNTSFPSDLGVVVEYDQRVYRTNNGRLGGTPGNQGGGDGIGVYLVDPNAPNYGVGGLDTTAGEPGGYGAGLGYSAVSNTGNAWCPAQQGVPGGYLGVGFDVYGNFQKSEKTEGFGQYHRATRPFSVALGHPDAFSGVDAAVSAARIPQSIGLRGAGVRYATTPGCTSPNNMTSAYGMVATNDPLVTAQGVRTVFQVKWVAGDTAGQYTGQYQAQGSASWTTVAAQEVPASLLPAGFSDSRGYVRFEVPDSAGAFAFRYTKTGNATTGTFSGITTDASLGTAPNYTPLKRTVGGYRWLAGTGNLSAYPNPTTTARVAANDAALRGAVIDNAATDSEHYRRVRLTLTVKADGTREVTVFWTGKLDVSDDRCYTASGVEITGVTANGTTDGCAAAGGTWRYGGAYDFQKQFSYDLATSPFQADLPASFRLGFSASTGWAVDFHQIRNLKVTSLVDLAVQKQVQATGAGASTDDAAWADSAVVRGGENAAYRIVASNNGPSDIDSAYPATLTDGLAAVPLDSGQPITWTATASGSARVCSSWSNPTQTCTDWSTTATGTGPIIDSSALRWYAPADGVSQVSVIVKGTVSAAAAPAEYPNTAEIVANRAGPQESDLTNNTDSATITLLPSWSLSKSADPASGSTVAAGQTVTYSVAATMVSAGGVADAVIHDSLADVAPYADFVTGSVRIDGQPAPAGVAVSEPTAANGHVLTVSGVGISSAADVTITYQVTVRTDAAPLSVLRNQVTGSAPGNPPVQCADPAEADFETHCVTEHRTPALIQVLKVGESSAGDIVAFDGSEWGVYPDDGGSPDLASPAAQLGAAPRTPAIDTGLFQLDIAPGTYWLREEKALDGFSLLPEPVEFFVATDGSISLADGSSSVLAACPAEPTSALCDEVPASHAAVPTIVVLDVPAVDLPDAGGDVDPRWYAAIGGLVLLLALGAIAVFRRRETRHRD